MAKLTVTSKRPGFRRGGRAWGDAPETVDTADFSAEQLELIRGESMLVVVEGGRVATAETRREDAIIAGIRRLDPENPDHFTNSGKPELRALREHVPDVTGAERDRVWADIADGA